MKEQSRSVPESTVLRKIFGSKREKNRRIEKTA
jgi:hypothetical protein